MSISKSSLLVACVVLLTAGPGVQTARANGPVVLQARALDRMRALFPQTRHWFRLVENAQFTRDEQGRLVPDYDSLTHARVRRRDNAGHTIVPHFPARADQPMRIASGEDPRVFMEIAPLAARPAPVSLQDGAVVYPDAYTDTDVFYKATPTHTDEYLVLRSAAAPTTWRFSVRRGPAIAMLRQAGEFVEAVDAQGVPLFRASQPVAIDHRGVRAFGTLRLEGSELVVRLDSSGLELPILVDPDWSPTGDMSFGRFYAGANLLPDGRILSTGGCSASVCSGDLTIGSCRSVVATGEALDLGPRTWSPVGSQLIARYFHVSADLPDGRVLLAGGCTNADCSLATASADLFTPAGNQFRPTGNLGEARGGASSVALRDGRVLVIGGCNSSSCSRRTEVFNAASGSFTTLAPLAIARGRAQAVLLADGRVLVIGGCTTIQCSTVLASAEVYDPVADRWSTVGSMRTPRAGHYATRIADGRVLTGGGCADQTCTSFLRSTDLFDPTSNAFVPGPDQHQARLGATSSLLPDGRVMVLEGCAGHTDCDRTSEIFDPATSTFGLSGLAVTERAFHQVVHHAGSRMLVAVGGCQPSTCSWWNETLDVSTMVPVLDAGTTPDAALDAAPGLDARHPDVPLVIDASVTLDGSTTSDARLDAPASDVPVGGGASCRCTTSPGHVPAFAWRIVILAFLIVAGARRSARRKARSKIRNDRSRTSRALEHAQRRSTCAVITAASVMLATACSPPSPGTDAMLDATGRSDDTGIIDPPIDVMDVAHELDPSDATYAPDTIPSLDAADPMCEPACGPCEVCAAGTCHSIGGRAAVAQLAAGWNHTLVIDTDGVLWAWGDNAGGQLGTCDRVSRDVATRLPVDPARWTLVAGGSRHSCGIQIDGTLWCWGINAEGQLGLGDTTDHTMPERVGTDADWIDVTCGGLHSCGVRRDGSAYCWGSNVAGQLGIGNALTSARTPQRIGTDVGWHGLSAKARFTCGLRSDDSLHCWGDNSNGQLGVGDRMDRHVPTAIPGGLRWSTVRMGPLHTCGITAAHDLYCWGSNATGQLGTGDNTQQMQPVRVGTASDWTALTGGFAHTCAIRSDATAWCWGEGANGRLGTGDTMRRLAPAMLTGGLLFNSITAGANHSCGVESTGAARCWGDDTWGQLGEGPGRSALVPASVCFAGLPPR